MPRGADPEFLSCDWGTSHFRLKRVSGGKIIAQFQDENGCKRLHQAAGGDTRKRAELFEQQLLSGLVKLLPSNQNQPNPLPLVISGMASSTIGWLELPYAGLPAPLDGTKLKTQRLSWNKPISVGDTWLVSGLASSADIMRGEETEAIGLLNSLPKQPANLVLLLPGTHSKHLHVSGGVLRDFQTYMTGELYAVLAQHSVLAASVAPNSAFQADGFFDGLDRARKQGLAASLFQTRTRQVLRRTPSDENAWFLSGLLIGSELKNLLQATTAEIHLGGTPPLRGLYGKALKHLAIPNCHAFSEADCENAVVRGHEIILSHLQS